MSPMSPSRSPQPSPISTPTYSLSSSVSSISTQSHQQQQQQQQHVRSISPLPHTKHQQLQQPQHQQQQLSPAARLLQANRAPHIKLHVVSNEYRFTVFTPTAIKVSELKTKISTEFEGLFGPLNTSGNPLARANLATTRLRDCFGNDLSYTHSVGDLLNDLDTVVAVQPSDHTLFTSIFPNNNNSNNNTNVNMSGNISDNIGTMNGNNGNMMFPNMNINNNNNHIIIVNQPTTTTTTMTSGVNVATTTSMMVTNCSSPSQETPNNNQPINPNVEILMDNSNQYYSKVFLS
ncbi:hypothetical protein SAMD00019534_092300 [Acytostelium subglobosum LB1]|uniref:hypothetical protein n=1 Tax=Acytostelium subglobosum LB1 TaxID=1410327 RepID=UPI000644CED5|nr:hypothetical protein SAMD00019534_092300 [Acytostelium subglobosum LB1]GAM26055.1 hypothetical protein SAMD00019534_092300 [Acytostelium subglobosum LB1]|eukprot:XP_012751098.1 hypothetical protein SAMD00019534_092300 [Acytostelium subglobosum LB1]